MTDEKLAPLEAPGDVPGDIPGVWAMADEAADVSSVAMLPMPRVMAREATFLIASMIMMISTGQWLRR
jgi:hypothetical protein